ncbi:MAG: TrmH family RNA methyltransferase [Chloroflexota bacterium]
MRTVESPANPLIRRMKELHTAAGRREHGAFLIEGTRLVAEAVAASWPLKTVLYDSRKAEEDERLGSLVRQIPGALPASTKAIKQASDTVTPQGIVAEAGLPAPAEQVDPAEPLVLILDGLADPGNAGTLLRSALASGIRTVLTHKNTVDLFSPKVVRGGMGAHFRLKLGTDLSWQEIVSLLGDGRATVVAEAGGDFLYYDYNWRRPSALIIGGEAYGPSNEARQGASARISIPLDGGVESLNAAVAGSVILFEAKRQRDKQGG